jgi:hypothetical protein
MRLNIIDYQYSWQVEGYTESSEHSEREGLMGENQDGQLL